MENEEWRQEYINGHYRRAAELLSTIVECGDVDCLLTLGTLYLYGMHLFDSEAEYMRFTDAGPVDQRRTFWESTEEWRLRGVSLLERASHLGSWAASQNPATYYSCNVKGLTEQERAIKAKYYYDLEERQRPAEL